MWNTKHLFAAALLLGAAACGGAEEAADAPAYLPDSVREQQERESVQIERLNSGLTGVAWSVRSFSGTRQPQSLHGFTVFGFDDDGTFSGAIGECLFTSNWERDGVTIDIDTLVPSDPEFCAGVTDRNLSGIKEAFEQSIIAGISDEETLFLSTLDGQVIEAELAN